jgi:hypothetical protein
MDDTFRKLLDELIAIGMPSGDFAVFGSGAMAIRDLRGTDDLDVVARGEAWETAKRLGERRTSEFGDEIYVFSDGNIEITDRWGDWDIDRLIDTADDFDGIRFVNLEITQQEKMRRGREKDLKDVELIGRYMTGLRGQPVVQVEGLTGLSEYHQRYAALSDEQIVARVNAKKAEVAAVLEASTAVIGKSPLLMAVLGCPDRRLIPLHQKMFEEVFLKTVKVTTYDISVDHLEGASGVIQHDVTEPLPGGPYDFILAHVLLPFIEEDQQWYAIFNSYDALKPGGLAIHVLDESDYVTEGDATTAGYHKVPLEKWKDKMRALGMDYVEEPIEHGVALGIIRR